MKLRRALRPWIVLARLALALSLFAPHAGHAAPHGAGDALTLVICGAAGAFEVTLDDPAPSPRAAPDPCCMMGCAGLPPMQAAALGVWARPAAPPPGLAPPHGARLADAPNARDPPMTR